MVKIKKLLGSLFRNWVFLWMSHWCRVCLLMLLSHSVTGETLMVPTCMGTSGGGE
ncbi:hypothetical protein NC652_007824 [Populus alba x Populus x berolinensis]|nr:hypothetical protein NC652_007824 [Populus alba x Populus x berolinensis]